MGQSSMTLRYLVYALFGFALGCSASDSSTNENQVKERVFDAQIEAVDKANALEQQILDEAAKQRQAIEDQGG
jgi:hypothetical protein